MASFHHCPLLIKVLQLLGTTIPSFQYDLLLAMVVSQILCSLSFSLNLNLYRCNDSTFSFVVSLVFYKECKEVSVQV